MGSGVEAVMKSGGLFHTRAAATGKARSPTVDSRCLEQGADLHMAQLMPLPLTVSCFSKIQIGFTFLAQAHPGSSGQRAVKRVCVLLGLA